MIRNFKDVHDYLKSLAILSKEVHYTLDQVYALLTYLDNPQDKIHIVHVAGTSGKTSTAYYTAALLKQTGAKVGLSVSPHMLEINERVQIDLTPLEEAEFCREFTIFTDLIAESRTNPSYFEAMVAFAFWEFNRQGVDYAVMEVGLGGLLDATNVVTRPDKVCIITDIGFDHTNVLGNTLREITTQKAGIIQKGNQVFAFEQSAEVMEVIASTCSERGATLQIVNPQDIDQEYEKTLPLFQRRNFYLATQAVSYVAHRDDRQLNDGMRVRAMQIRVPGRMERFAVGTKSVVVDGAHNGQKMTALVESMQSMYPGKTVAVLLGFAAARDNRWQHAIDALLPYAGHIIVSAFDQEADDMPKAFIPPAEVAAYIRTKGRACIIEPKLQTAFDLLMTQPEDMALITGSLYLFSGVYPLLARHR